MSSNTDIFSDLEIGAQGDILMDSELQRTGETTKEMLSLLQKDQKDLWDDLVTR